MLLKKKFWVLAFSVRIWYLAYPMDRSFLCNSKTELHRVLVFSEILSGYRVLGQAVNAIFSFS